MAEYFEQSFIEEITVKIRMACGYENSQLINMEDVVKQIGFDLIRYSDNPNINGKVYNSSTKKEIHVNTNSDRNENFTIAHEIGHIILHHKAYNGEEVIVDYRTENNEYNPKEFQANMFASAFLMPESEARKVWELVGNIDVFSQLFNVSRQSAQIRLSILGLI